ncbi:hypothetical protein DFH11DRAFT_1876698 [Phellopilus nigrolimitatus]|nr:hypothetical protein DFH11DRAFT_1876698 [Phellopilus nigrolimitatus]
MFRFNFSDIELDVEGNPSSVYDGSTRNDKEFPESTNFLQSGAGSSDHGSRRHDGGSRVRELTVEELTEALPPVFSYSPLIVPLTGGVALDESIGGIRQAEHRQQKSITLLRRDLFDARYQLISQDDNVEGGPSSGPGIDMSSTSEANEESANALTFVDNPSDLVPGVYEGGLKTWECSLDLVDYLASVNPENEIGGTGAAKWMRGKRVLEIGCGTGVPSLYLLHELFSQVPMKDDPSTEIVLQDYNDLVLRLVTFPNLLLAWYASLEGQAYRSRRSPSEADEENESFDITQPGDMHITPGLLAAFRTSLEDQHISVRFIAGSWQALSEDASFIAKPFDVAMASETIYDVASLPSQIRLLKRAMTGDENKDIHALARNLSVEESRSRTSSSLCLVAAKVLYFGVGGGVMDFEHVVREYGGTVTTILQRKAGVERKVMRINWNILGKE